MTIQQIDGVGQKFLDSQSDCRPVYRIGQATGDKIFLTIHLVSLSWERLIPGSASAISVLIYPGSRCGNCVHAG
jgi:hypothetical protein